MSDRVRRTFTASGAPAWDRRARRARRERRWRAGVRVLPSAGKAGIEDSHDIPASDEPVQRDCPDSMFRDERIERSTVVHDDPAAPSRAEGGRDCAQRARIRGRDGRAMFDLEAHRTRGRLQDQVGLHARSRPVEEHLGVGSHRTNPLLDFTDHEGLEELSRERPPLLGPLTEQTNFVGGTASTGPTTRSCGRRSLRRSRRRPSRPRRRHPRSSESR